MRVETKCAYCQAQGISCEKANTPGVNQARVIFSQNGRQKQSLGASISDCEIRGKILELVGTKQ